jgi:hypothetical protein
VPKFWYYTLISTAVLWLSSILIKGYKRRFHPSLLELLQEVQEIRASPQLTVSSALMREASGTVLLFACVLTFAFLLAVDPNQQGATTYKAAARAACNSYRPDKSLVATVDSMLGKNFRKVGCK